jgi:hypothetical protein
MKFSAVFGEEVPDLSSGEGELGHPHALGQ